MQIVLDLVNYSIYQLWYSIILLVCMILQKHM